MPVEGQEYLMDKKGKVKCLVCKEKPLFGNLKKYREHQRSKQHLRVYREWKKETRAKLLFSSANSELDLLGSITGSKRPQDSLTSGAHQDKKRKLDASEMRKKQKELVTLLKSMKKENMKKILEKVAKVAPEGIKHKPNGKKSLSPAGIVSMDKLSELIMFCEGFRCQNVSKLAYESRCLREWQLLARIKQPEENRREEKAMETPSPEYNPMTCWRRMVVSGKSTLHDLSRLLAKAFQWLAEDAGKAHGRYDWHKNQGKAVGMFYSTDPELSKSLGSKLKLQGLEVCNVFLKYGDLLVWKFGDWKLEVRFEGVGPSKDPLRRELPRLVGGVGASPAYLHKLKHYWESSWGIEELFKLNLELLGDRHFNDGFKDEAEWEKCRSISLRRAAPIINDAGMPIKPWTKDEQMHAPFAEDDAKVTWWWHFTVVGKCNVHAEPAGGGDLLSCLPDETEVVADDFMDGSVHIFKPFKGWCSIRNKKEVRTLMPIQGRHAVLPMSNEFT